MTKFEQFLITINFEGLQTKTVKELEELLQKIYDFCNTKYGAVKEPFFNENWKTNTKIKRGANEGLDVHHMWEYDPDNPEVCSLSDPATAEDWFKKGYTKYQLAEYLVYCNWIEHQAIHAIIDTLRTRQYGKYRPGCIERRAPMLNKYFNEGDDYLEPMMLNENFTARNYFKVALETVKDELDTYSLIMDEWAMANGIDDWYIFGYALESLENCFEMYSEE